MADKTYQYYQDPQGRIIENSNTNGEWLIHGDDIPESAIVAKDAQDGTPLAATSWSSSATGGIYVRPQERNRHGFARLISNQRQIFYLDASGAILTSNTTGDDSWSQAVSILTDDSAAPNSIALAVSSGTDPTALNGIRVYYGT